ncbi:uncharacterized protein A1O5_09737 [Cladophialophora psammophila CBS 110553]|uniref:Uncharacterized protein n=1 Tax=Cladophialophora psammophila CBS 110553 TaxID=1182543 RepID=W9WQZ1_9EURO|nr:uncharacterized protein A1O5_09737 [Cladophialophora psammophila CBS 110553]EXJ67091.1 hypothetical protein A1O5_09737 [Cladophialophora psammophila CBS 110553]
MARNILDKLDEHRLQKMGATVKFYHEDDDGNIRPRKAWVSVGADQYNNHLDSGARVALALTELCCQRAMGKVFVFQLHPGRAKTRGEPENFHAYKAWKAIPELFYLPHVWTESERTEWDLLTPRARLHRLLSAYGWVDGAIPILPFDVEVQDVRLEKPQLDGLSGAPVTVYLSPKPYVGLSRKMHELCERQFRREGGRDWPQRVVWKASKSAWDDFDRLWSVQGGQGILEALDTFYREGSPDGEECITTYGILTERLCAAAHEAATKRGEAAGEAEQGPVAV